MIHIHPFPARMAPGIALERLAPLPDDAIVLDPMCGSGMVLGEAARSGRVSIGCDLDPLARLISRVSSTKVKTEMVWKYYDKLLRYCQNMQTKSVHLPWIDDDDETINFIEYWFASPQKKQLRLLAKFFEQTNSKLLHNHKNVLIVAVSRLIITKEPKASLARDTAHSRPHKTIAENEFDILSNLKKSVDHVLRALAPANIQIDTKTYLDDARTLKHVSDKSIDAIITSPPYLNAIDYMRGHKFSLVWLGYKISQLRNIRSSAIGAEIALKSTSSDEFDHLMENLRLSEMDRKTTGMLRRYYTDLKLQLTQTQRVLKAGAAAHFVIGNSSIKGNFIKNSELLKFAAKEINLDFVDETVREIPDNRRYLPITVNRGNSLAGRMRTEHVIQFAA